MLFKLRYGKSLRTLRGRQMEELKMKEMAFLPRTNSHIFKGLGRSCDLRGKPRLNYR